MNIGKRWELSSYLGRKGVDVESHVDRIMGGMPPSSHVKRDISTQFGITSLDLGLGGGLPSGHVEIYGEESSGKTALSAHVLARSQQLGLVTLLCTTEFLDKRYLSRMDVDMGKLGVIRGDIDNVREVLTDFLSKTGRIAVIDSLSALRPVYEGPGSWNESVYRLLSVPVAQGSLLLVTNQVRNARSAMGSSGLSNKTESAARWVHDMYSARLAVSREEVHEASYTMVIDVKVNRMARPSALIRLPADKGRGVDISVDRIRAGVSTGVIEKRGAWFFYRGIQLGQGERAAAETAASPELSARIGEDFTKSL